MSNMFGNLFGSGVVGNNLGGYSQGGINQLSAAANFQNQAQAAGFNNFAQQQVPTWNNHVPAWDEGGWEPWLGKPDLMFGFCQRCLFL